MLYSSEENTQRQALCSTLSAAGIRVESFSNLAQLHASLRECEPEALLIVLPLPDQDTLLLPQMLAQTDQGYPVAILGTMPASQQWASMSQYPYLQINKDLLNTLPETLRQLEQNPPIRHSPHKSLLDAITMLTASLFTEFELEPLLQRIIEEAVTLIPEAQAGSLLMDAGEYFAFRAFVGYPDELYHVKLPPTSAFLPELRQGKIVGIHDIAGTNTSTFPPELSNALKRYGRIEEIHETLAAPLLQAGTMVGYITVDSFAPGARFSDDDREALGYLASIATIAMHNAQLHSAERTARDLAETIGLLGQQLVASLEVEEVLSQVLDALFRLTPCDAADVLLVQDGDAIVAQRRGVGTFPHPPEHFRLNIEHTANLSQAAREKTPLLITDTAQTRGWVVTSDTLWIRSHIAAPFFLDERLAGFLCVSGAHTEQFSQGDCDTLTALIPLVAIALRNASLFQDALTARQRAETAYEDLRRLDAMKSQFIQNVSHELRTPLAIVKGYLDLVLDASFGFKLEPNMAQALRAMQTHTNRLTNLVESITTLENVAAGQLDRHPQPVLPVFLRALQAIRQKVDRHHLELIVNLEEGLPQVNLDPQQLGLALWHLLDNAIKFNRRGGHIWLEAWEQGDEVFCTIRDEGIGIPATEQPRIFDRFYQVDGSTRRRYEGMGLGLSITKEVMESHGGRVWVNSEGPDAGTTFTIALPVYHEDQTL